MANEKGEKSPAAESKKEPDNEKKDASKKDKAKDNEKKRGPGDSNNSNDNKQKGRKNKRSKHDKKNHTWRKEGDDRGNMTKSIHPGSYAHAAMREQFNVTLPPHLLPPDKPPTSEDYEAEKKKQEPKNFSKKKVAFLLAYLGKGFSGFQTNEGQKTLQAEFELALVRSELLSPLNFGVPHKYSWSTSGRTDKGVHACAQVCSCKIQVKPDQSMDDIRELINSHLPDKFRVLDLVRCGRSFCAKTGRSRVRYQYMIPAFCFWNRKELKKVMLKAAPKPEDRTKGEEALTEEECKKIKDKIKDYRVTNEQLESLKQALQKYQGTHPFHNFTRGLTSKDANAMRYIVSFHVEEPVVFQCNGFQMQWIPTQVLGQSFLMHQIRKMISVALDSVRLNDPDMVPSLLAKSTRGVTDLAPAQGLFLEMSYYDHYNKKIQNQTDLERLDWSIEDTPAFARWKDFRDQVLMTHVVNEEDEEGNFVKYLYNHEFYFNTAKSYKLIPEEESGSDGKAGADDAKKD